jgi:nucleotide-binding universal stress UspA family protein
MKRILVPTDFSPTAEKAFRFSLDIASRANGTVILYHICSPEESKIIDSDSKRRMYNADIEVNALKRLQRLRKKVLGDSLDVHVSTIVGRSPLIDNILGFAENNNIDLIVMGTQGASGLKKTIIGSVAARVVEKSDLPVLLIPAKYEIKELNQFVFATNYRAADKLALTLVNAMAKLFEAEVTVVHFANAYHSELDKIKVKDDFDSYAYTLQRVFNESKIKFHLLETTSVVETMETLDGNFPYDVMAMVRRNKTFLEKFFVKSFTQNMVYLTKKPLLIIPDPE